MDLFLAPDGRPRCGWAGAAPEFLGYHDNEWGFPVADDVRLFEKISLEGFQSGLSWRTILAKRDSFREAFAGFDFHAVAGFDRDDVVRMLADPGIVRHPGKIEAVINNARMAVELQAEAGSLAAFFWRYEPAPDELSQPQSVSASPASVTLSKELKRRGWKFVGPTTIFAFMQAMGLINDHAAGCVTRHAAAARRSRFTPPEQVASDAGKLRPVSAQEGGARHPCPGCGPACSAGLDLAFAPQHFPPGTTCHGRREVNFPGSARQGQGSSGST